MDIAIEDEEREKGDEGEREKKERGKGEVRDFGRSRLIEKEREIDAR